MVQTGPGVSKPGPRSTGGAVERLPFSALVPATSGTEAPNHVTTEPTAAPPGPRAKLGRAKSHLEALHREVVGFHDSKPFRVVREPDPDGGWRARVEPWPPNIPAGIPLTFGDLIHNLRSALDILVCDLVRHNRPDALSDQTSFPFARHATHLKSAIKSKARGASNDVQRAILELRPFEGGNGELWRLHRLDILDKHSLILPTMTASDAVNVGKMMSQQMRKAVDWEVPELDLWIRGASPCDDEGGVVYRDKTGAEPDYDLQLRFNVMLHEPGLVDCEPIVPFAARLIQTTEGVISGFDRYFA